MNPSPVRLYKPKDSDRMAVVSVEPATGGQLVRVARGPSARKLTKGNVFGPFGNEELTWRFQEVVDSLRQEGFMPTGLHSLLESLHAPQPSTRARAAARLGWRRSVEAVAPLIDALGESVDETCSLIDALGAIGDARAIPVVREYASRKLLSRRRSAVEALRSLGDTEGLSAAVERARESLPETVRAALDASDSGDDTPASTSALSETIRALDPKYQGLALDTLYEIGTAASTGAVRLIVETLSFDRPYHWRYLKSIYKRTMLRHDLATFASLSVSIERQARSTPGTRAKVKSGYDGIERETPIFQRKTQNFLRRLAWRYLRNLAAYRASLYPHASAEALAAYTPDDAEEPRGLRGEFARCYLLHRILLGSSTRFRLQDRGLVFSFRDSKSTHMPEDLREESFPDLWDAEPFAYLRVLEAARLPEAQAFAYRAIAGPHRAVLHQAGVPIVLRLLHAPYEPTRNLGLDELRRRFDPERPDLAVLDQLLSETLPEARTLGREWLRQSAALWTLDEEWLLVFLTFPDVEIAGLAADLATPTLIDRPGLRASLATRLLALLRQPEPSPGTHDVYARIAREALAGEIDASLSIGDLLLMITEGSPPAQALAGSLLGKRPESIDYLGLEGLAALAEHEVASVREAAHELMRLGSERFQLDPAPLLLLVESQWDDTRSLAFEILRHRIDLESLGPGGLMGLLDSNRPDVQDVGRELARRHLAELDPQVLMSRLVEHPHPNMRRFALDLIVNHLPEGAWPLVGLEPFFRSVLLDLQPDRLLKRRSIDFLLKRGLRDSEQAEVAARLLGGFVRMDVRADAEHALEAIVRLSLTHPGLTSPVTVGLGGVA